MIGYIQGIVLYSEDTVSIINVSGVGYEVNVSQYLTAETVARLHIHTLMKENSLSLYGFRLREERDIFRKLLTVSGVGARSAMNIVKSMLPSEIRKAVADKNVNKFTEISGIGRKTAEAIIEKL